MDQRKRSGQSPITSTRFALSLLSRFSSVIRSSLRYTLRAFGIANRRLIPNDISLPFQLHSLLIPNMPQGLMRAVHTAIHPNTPTRASSYEIRYAVAIQTVCSISSSLPAKSLRVWYIAAPVLFAILISPQIATSCCCCCCKRCLLQSDLSPSASPSCSGYISRTLAITEPYTVFALTAEISCLALQ